MSRKLRDALLLTALVGASAWFVIEILRVDEPNLPTFGLAEAPMTPAPEPFTLPELRPVPLGEVSTALERPLFVPSRRPPAAQAAPPAALNATLAGVLTDGSEKVAIITTSGADRAVRLREGELFHGWRVTRIDDYSVVLERDGRTERLVLTFRGPPPGAGPAERGVTSQPGRQR